MNHNMKGRSAFTLVELLVVITIIGMLAALISVAASMAMGAARRSAIKMEMTQLSVALENYKTKYGEYPPDGTDTAAVIRHLRKAFPKMMDPPKMDATNTYVLLPFKCGRGAHSAFDEVPVTPATALVLFLGGNLSKNPLNPLSTSGDRVDAFYEFKEDQLIEVAGGPQYFPSGLERDEVAPFVYFKARLTNDGGAYFNRDSKGNAIPLCWPLDLTTTPPVGFAVPYADSTKSDPDPANLEGSKWREATKYQIVTAGLDGLFSDPTLAGGDVSVRGSKTTNFGWSEADYDNLTNFAEGTIGDELEQ